MLRLDRAILALVMVVASACDPSDPRTFMLGDPTSGPARIGEPVDFTVGHCGLSHVVDLDGSYWDLQPESMTAEEKSKFGINSDRGTITLLDENIARYTSSSGGEATLVRHRGPKRVYGCM